MTAFFRKLIVAGLLATTVGAASAQNVFDFANLKYNDGSFSGFLPTASVPCSWGDLCSSDATTVLNGEMSYFQDGITVTAQGSISGGDYGVNAAVVQDHENAYNGMLYGEDARGAGLGVYHLLNDGMDDNISSGEAIKLHFDAPVTLSSVGMRAEGHGTIGWSYLGTFEYSFDNLTWTNAYLPKYYGSLNPPYDELIDIAHPGQFAVTHTGQDFYFRYGGNLADEFYISSMTVTTPVSEPDSYALMLAGLGLFGFVIRRRMSTPS